MITLSSRLRPALTLCVLVLMLATLVGCGGGGASNATGSTNDLTSSNRLSVTTTYNSVPVGVVTQFTASLASTWTSSNPGVAVIDSNGVALGVAPGITTITATSTATGTTQTVEITFTVTGATIAAINVSPSTYTFAGQASTNQFTAIGVFSDNNQYGITGQVTWASSDTAAATVSTVGVVTDVAAGNAIITATWPGTAISGSAQVTTF